VVALFGRAWERTDLLRGVGDARRIGGARGGCGEREFQWLSGAPEIPAVEKEIRFLEEN
jgi:hypothetical protein